jgi:hypothetical protein
MRRSRSAKKSGGKKSPSAKKGHSGRKGHSAKKGRALRHRGAFVGFSLGGGWGGDGPGFDGPGGDGPGGDGPGGDGPDIGPGGDDPGRDEPAVPVQRLRYLRIVNSTGQELMVYVRMTPGAPAQGRKMAIDEVIYLRGEEGRVALGEVYLWARAGGKAWGRFKDEPLVLVPRPYRALGIGTFTHTFR